MAYQVRIEAQIRTGNGLYRRISTNHVEFASTPVSPWAQDDMLVYPDIRCECFIVWVADTGGTGEFVKHSEYKATASNTQNMAYAKVPASIVLDAPDGGDFPGFGLNQAVDRDMNRIYVSATDRPRDLSADRVYYAGSGPDDVILGFASNALPISEGQYGDYPLYVGCRTSIWMMQPSSEVAFIDVTPLSTTRGFAGRNAFDNLENLVFFASRDGVFMLAPGLSQDSISRQLDTGSFGSDFAGCIGWDTAVGALSDAGLQRSEVWVAAGNLTYIFSPRHGRWSILDRVRTYFKRYRSRLYGVGELPDLTDPENPSVGVIFDETGIRSELVEFLAIFSPLFLGYKGHHKRLWRLALSQHVSMELLRYKIKDRNITTGAQLTLKVGRLPTGQLPNVVNLYAGQAYAPEVWLTGQGYPGQGFVGFELDFEVRNLNRGRITVDRVGNPSDDGTSDFGWDCLEGFTIQPNEAPTLDLWDVQIAGSRLPDLNLWDVIIRNAGSQIPELDLWDVALGGFAPLMPPELDLWDVSIEPAGSAPELDLWDVALEGTGGVGQPEPPTFTVPSSVDVIAGQENLFLDHIVESLVGYDLVDLRADFVRTGSSQTTPSFPSNGEWGGWNGMTWLSMTTQSSIEQTGPPAIRRLASTQQGFTRARLFWTFWPQPAEIGNIYEIQWRAEDQHGNVGTATTTVNVIAFSGAVGSLFPDHGNYFSFTSDDLQATAALDNLFLNLSDPNIPAGFWAKVKPDGSDIRIARISPSGAAQEVAREIAAIDTVAETGGIFIDGTGFDHTRPVTYRCYYNNPAATEPPASAANGKHNVWGSMYDKVSHDAGLTDSTANAKDGINNGSVVGTQDGMFSKGRFFDGTNDDIDQAISSVTVPFTIQVYCRAEVSSPDQMILSNWNSGSQDVYIDQDGAGRFRFNTDNPVAAITGAETLNVYKWLTGTQRTSGASGKEFYIDGVSQGTATGGAATFNSGGNFHAGDDGSTPPPRKPFQGHIEEIRFLNTDMSPVYAQTEANNLLNLTFWTIGSEQTN